MLFYLPYLLFCLERVSVFMVLIQVVVQEVIFRYLRNFAACFSPLVLCIFYTIYHLTFQKYKIYYGFNERNICILFVAFFKTKTFLDDFCLLCYLHSFAYKTLMQSYRVRLPVFRLRYKIFIECSIIFDILLLFNRR